MTDVVLREKSDTGNPHVLTMWKFALWVTCVGLAFLSYGGASVTDNVLTLDTSDGDLTYTDEIAATVTKIVKTGDGKATINRGAGVLNPFVGDIEIRQGTLAAPYLANLGKMKTLTVKGGATFDISGDTNDKTGDIGYMNQAVVTIAGSGVDGNGAIVRDDGNWVTTNNNGDRLFKNVELSGDAKVSAVWRWGISNGTLNLNGHTLTVVAGSTAWNKQLVVESETINPDGADGTHGHIKLIGGKMMTKVKMNGSADNHLIVDGKGAMLDMYQMIQSWSSSLKIPWTLVWKDGLELCSDDDVSSISDLNGINCILGGVTCAAGATLTNNLGASTPMNWAGAVTNATIYRKGGLLTIRPTKLTNFKHSDDSNAGKQTRFYGANGADWTFTGCGMNGGKLDFRNPGGTMKVLNNTAVYWSMSGKAATRHTTVHFHEGSYAFNKLDFGFRQGIAQHNQVMVTEGGDVTFDYIMHGYTSDPAAATKGGAGGTNTVTVTGAGSKLTMKSYMRNEHSGQGVAILNVTDGATYVSPATYILIGKSRGYGARFYINCDGGTLGVTKNGGYGRSDEPSDDLWPTAVTVYEGGLTVDTSAATGDKTFQGPIVCPKPGRRIKSIPLPTDAAFTGSRLFHPKGVRINAASGEASSAYLQIDEDTLLATNILVTSKGFGYGADETVTATVWDNDDKTYDVTCVLEDAPDASVYRGFVKRGAKKLVLKGVNTYYGPTKVESGTLQFAVENGRPADSSVEVADGATVDFGGFAQTMPALGGAGAVANGSVTVTEALKVNAADALAGKTLQVADALAFGENAVVEVTGEGVDPESAETQLQFAHAKTVATANAGISGTPTLKIGGKSATGGWRLRVKNNNLLLDYPRGFFLIVR